MVEGNIRANQALTDKSTEILAPIPQGMVPVVGPTGDNGLIPEAELQNYRQQGYRIASPDEIRSQQAHEIYGTPAGQLVAAGLGGLDTVSLGFGKGVLHAGAQLISGKPAADALSRDIQGYEQENPGSYTLGQIVGALVPTVTTGGIGGLAEGAEGLVGKGILGTTAKWGAQGAMEGALYGAGAVFSEDQLGDTQQSAERLIAGAAKAGLLGLGIGGTMGLAGGTLMKFGGAAIAKLPDARELADHLAGAALNADVKDRRILEKMGLDVERLGSFMNESPEISAVMAKGGSIQKIAEAAEKSARRIGTDVDNALEHIVTTAEAVGKKPNARQIIDAINQEVIAPLERSPFHSDVAAQIRKEVDKFGAEAGVYARERTAADVAEDIAAAAGESSAKAGRATGEIRRDPLTGKPVIMGEGEISFKRLKELQSDLAKRYNTKSNLLSEKDFIENMRQVGGIMNTHFKKQLQEFPEQLAQLEKLNEQYKLAKQVEVISAKEAIKREAHTAGAKDLLSGFGIAKFFGAKGLALALATKVAKEHGPQFAAAVLDRASRMSALKGAMTEVSNVVSKSARQLVRGSIRAGVAVTMDRSKQANKVMKSLDRIAHNPEAMAAPLGTHIDESVAPMLRQAYINQNIKIIQDIYAKAPKGIPIMPMLPNSPRIPPSKAQIAKWMRIVDVYNNPIGAVVSNFKKGQLTVDHVDALDRYFGTSIAPELRQAVGIELTQLAAEGKMPSPRARQQLALLLRAGTDAALQPEFIATQQAIANQPPDSELFDNQESNAATPRSQSKRSSMGGGEETMDETSKDE